LASVAAGGSIALDAQEIKQAVVHQAALRAAAEEPFVNLRDPAQTVGARREMERLALAAEQPRQRAG
jgi:hypothetical protein